MNKLFWIERLDSILVIRFNGPCTVKSILQAVDEVALYPSHYSRLWDLSFGIDVPNQGLKEIASYTKKKLNYPARVGVVASEDLSFGLMRMLEVYREEENLDFRVFRNEAEALGWLREAPD